MSHDEQEHDDEFMQQQDDEEAHREMMEDFWAPQGDARRCKHHPDVKTSSDDGLFDCDCYKCEYESDEAYRAEKEGRDPVPYPVRPEPVKPAPEEDDEIPF